MAAKRRAKQGPAEDGETNQAADDNTVLDAENSGPRTSEENQPGESQRSAVATTAEVPVGHRSPACAEDECDSDDDDAVPNAEEDPYGAANDGFPMSSPVASSPVGDCAEEDDMGSSELGDAEAAETSNVKNGEPDEVEVSYF